MTVVASVVVSLVASFVVATSVQSPSATIGTDITQNTATQSYTDGADFRQNVQAIAERMSGLTQGQLLQADSSGNMEAVSTISSITGITTTGTSTFDGAYNQFGNSVTSTIQVGGDNGPGCVIFGANDTGDSVYVSFSSAGAPSATTTKPAYCQTAQ